MVEQIIKINIEFQSTLPCGSDLYQLKPSFAGGISIHAPLRERHCFGVDVLPDNLFQSTLPYGSDRFYQPYLLPYICISIHAPSRERR